MALAKCRVCGCLREALDSVAAVLPARGTDEAELRDKLGRWRAQMGPLEYACLGCRHCYGAEASNAVADAYPLSPTPASPTPALEREQGEARRAWPPEAGDYLVLGDGPSRPVAVSTLGSGDLAAALAALAPAGLAIAGKTETENIGVDKVVKNVIANPALRYLILAGPDPQGHASGRTMLALAANGLDEDMRVIGSPGKRPVLRNVTPQEVVAFRRQVEIVDLIGCEDLGVIAARVASLAPALAPTLRSGLWL